MVEASAAPRKDHAKPDSPCLAPPRAEMVRRHAGGEADLLGLLDVAEQLRRVDLLMRTVKTDDRHFYGVPVLTFLSVV